MKKTTKKVLALTSGAALLVSASVMGTMAYLTSTTNQVDNTFTVGNVSFDKTIGNGLDEADVNEYGELLNKQYGVWKEGEELATRVVANEYKLIPDHEYIKDPTVHIADGSEDCWLFVKVENGIKAIEADTENTDHVGTIEEQMDALGWKLVTGQTNVYAYKETVSENEDIVVFEGFKLTEKANVADYANAKITIMAYAVQADGIGSSDEAWAAAPATWNAQ